MKPKTIFRPLILIIYNEDKKIKLTTIFGQFILIILLKIKNMKFETIFRTFSLRIYKFAFYFLVSSMKINSNDVKFSKIKILKTTRLKNL